MLQQILHFGFDHSVFIAEMESKKKEKKSGFKGWFKIGKKKKGRPSINCLPNLKECLV